jgi:hypothetical protein
VNTTIENICYEYADDVLFSQENSSNGCPNTIIVYLKKEYISELSCFLNNYNYNLVKINSFGVYFSLVRFSLQNGVTRMNKKKEISEDL